MKMRRSLSSSTALLLVAALAAFGISGAGAAESSGIVRAIDAQSRNTDSILKNHDVVGTAVGLNSQGSAVVRIFTMRPGVAGLPDELDGVAVEVVVTGRIYAVGAGAQTEVRGGKPGSTTLSTTSVWPRPVPIGISTGNGLECSAGTISARTLKGGQVYALSNNHVYALENSAPLGSAVYQPGLYDTGCAASSTNVLGNLSDFVTISFSSSANNAVDAAIASTSLSSLGNSTPSDGYGTPKTSTTAASLGLSVQKYGRTTQLTKGQVTDINATILVTYSHGTARFVNQIVVQSNKPFIKPGDSGSLLVTSPGASPTGLLFAGDSSGKFAVANQIASVLSALGITIDGA